MCANKLRPSFLAIAGAIALSIFGGPADAADRASYLATCGKDADKGKCTCVADKVDQAFKNKALVFAYQALAQPIGELVNAESGLSEKEEDEIVDKTFTFMKACGLVN